MKIALPARTPGGAATEASGDGLSLRQALFREQHTFGLIVTDSDGTITDWSPAAARIFGYSKKDVLGKTPSMFHRPDEQPSLTASILASVERFGYWAGETHIVRKDGSEGITDTVVFSYIDERGRPATIGINRDITESKQIQDALRESAERLQLITDNVSAHIVHYDADRRYRFVNDAVVELLGRPREHIIGKRVAELLDEDTYRKLEPNIEKALGGEEVTFERERMSPDGSAMLFQSNYLPHIDDHGRVLGCYAVSVDITERKRAETLAGENEKRLRLITDNVAATIIYFDADQRYQFVNKGVEEIYGLPHDEIVGRTLLDVQGEAGYSQIGPHVQTALGGAEVTFEQERTSPDGRRRHYQTTYHPDYGDNGDVVGVYVVLVDITDRKRAENVLLDNEQRLRLITDNMPANVIYFDTSQRFQFVNKGVEDIFGLPHDQIIGKRAREIQGDDLYFEVGPYIERALAGEEVVFEQIRAARDGTLRNFQSIYLPHLDERGRVLGCYALSVDITARTQAEAEVKENEQLVRLITDNVAGNIFYIDADNRYRFVNKAAEQTIGLPREEIIGKRVSDIQDAAFTRQILPYMEMALAGQEVTFELERNGPDGKPRGYQSTCLPHFVADGKVAGYYVLTVDITERKRAENLARQNEARLRLITDNVAANITYLDTDQRYRFVNQSFADMLGMPPSEIIGKSTRDVQDKATYQYVTPYIKTALRGEEVTFERTRTGADGKSRSFQSTYLPDFDEHGEVRGVYGLSVDISERKTAETAAIENEARLRLITDNISATIVYFDADQRYRYVNKAIEDIHGIAAENLIGRRVADVIGETGYREIEPHIVAGLSGQQATFEQLRTLPDGSKRNYHSRAPRKMPSRALNWVESWRRDNGIRGNRLWARWGFSTSRSGMLVWTPRTTRW